MVNQLTLLIYLNELKSFQITANTKSLVTNYKESLKVLSGQVIDILKITTEIFPEHYAKIHIYFYVVASYIQTRCSEILVNS